MLAHLEKAERDHVMCPRPGLDLSWQLVDFVHCLLALKHAQVAVRPPASPNNVAQPVIHLGLNLRLGSRCRVGVTSVSRSRRRNRL
jgi:hypothetical protein